MSRGLRAWSGSFATNVGLLGIGTVTGILTARLLGPDARGELAKIIFWGAYLGAFTMAGIPAALTNAIAKEPEDRSVAANAIAIAAGFNILGALGFFLIGPALIPNLERSSLAMLYVALFLPANAMSLTLGAIDRGLQDFRRYNLVRMAPQAIYLFGVLALWAAGLIDVNALVWATLIGVWLTVLVRAADLPGKVEWSLSLAKAKSLLHFGVTFYLTELGRLVFARADKFILATWFSDAEFGFYVVALTLAGAGIGKVSGATRAVLLPKLSAAKTETERTRTLRDAVTGNLSVAVVFNLVVAACSPFLIPTLFGEEYLPAVPIAMIVCLSEIPACYTAVATLALRVMGDWKSGPTAQAVGFVAFAGVAALLAPRQGGVGVAWAVLLSQLCTMAMLVVQVSRRSRLSPVACVVPPVALLRSLPQMLKRTFTRKAPRAHGKAVAQH